MEREIEVSGIKSDRSKILLEHLKTLTRSLSFTSNNTTNHTIARTSTKISTNTAVNSNTNTNENKNASPQKILEEIQYVADDVADRTGKWKKKKIVLTVRLYLCIF